MANRRPETAHRTAPPAAAPTFSPAGAARIGEPPSNTVAADAREPRSLPPALTWRLGREDGAAGPVTHLLDRLGSGEPLPSAVRARLEPRLGRSFEHVRLHRDGTAASEVRSRSALAFAVGSHIAVDPAAYRGDTLMSDALLAHELAHTVHQQGAVEEARGRGGDSAGLEREADAAALQALFGGSRAPDLSQGRGLQVQACAIPSGTAITPAHFNFQTVIPYTPPGSGGWQAACVHATMSKSIQRGPTSSIVCQFEVGMPIQHHSIGHISPSYAATMAATAANAAAYTVLAAVTYPVTAADCIAFRRAFEAELNLVNLGARVSACNTPGLPVTTFP